MRDDERLLLVEARIEDGEILRRLAGARGPIERGHRVRLGEVDLPVAAALERFAQLLRLLDRGRANQHRLHLGVGFLDLAHHRAQLLVVGAIDLVVLVEAIDRLIGRNFDDDQLVDLGEFVGLGRRRAGHPGEFLVKAEIVLERDRREGDVLRLNRDAFFGFERLMLAFRIAPARHHAAGEFVDDDDFVVAHDIVLVALEQLVRAQGLIDVMDEGRVGGFVERSFRHQPRFAQQRLDVLVADLGQADGALLFVDVEILALQAWDEGVDADVEARAVFRRTGDDQRRARLVDENRIDLVDDGEAVPALDHLRHVVLHVVAQIVETEFVVGAVGDVGGVGLPAFLVLEAMHDHADAHAEERVDLAHPFGVATGQIVVDGDDVHALAGERVEIDGQSGDQRLAFAGAHLGDRALVQHEASDELDVEVALFERAFGRLAHRRERRRGEIFEGRAGGQRGAEFLGLAPQLLVAQRREFRLQGVDGGDLRPIALQAPVIRGPEQLLQERVEHWRPFRPRDDFARPIDRSAPAAPSSRRGRPEVPRAPALGRSIPRGKPPDLAGDDDDKSAKDDDGGVPFALRERSGAEIGAAAGLVNDRTRRAERERRGAASGILKFLDLPPNVTTLFGGLLGR